MACLATPVVPCTPLSAPPARLRDCAGTGTSRRTTAQGRSEPRRSPQSLRRGRSLRGLEIARGSSSVQTVANARHTLFPGTAPSGWRMGGAEPGLRQAKRRRGDRHVSVKFHRNSHACPEAPAAEALNLPEITRSSAKPSHIERVCPA